MSSTQVTYKTAKFPRHQTNHFFAHLYINEKLTWKSSLETSVSHCQVAGISMRLLIPSLQAENQRNRVMFLQPTMVRTSHNLNNCLRSCSSHGGQRIRPVQLPILQWHKCFQVWSMMSCSLLESGEFSLVLSNFFGKFKIEKEGKLNRPNCISTTLMNSSLAWMQGW